MAADIVLSGSTLNISGTSGNDTVEVREVGSWDGTTLSVTVKNADTGALLKSHSIPKEWVANLQLIGLAGNDTIVCGTSIPSVILGGDGNDTIQVQSKNHTIDGGTGTDNVAGTAALDYLMASADNIELFQGKTKTQWGSSTQSAGGYDPYSTELMYEKNGAWGY